MPHGLGLFNNVLTTFLGLEHVSCIAVYAGSKKRSSFTKNNRNLSSKMNECLKGVKWHEGEYLMTEFSFLDELSL